MADNPSASKKQRPSPTKEPKKPSLIQRLFRKLESKRRRLKREDPNIYPLY